jgi:hypothetical protein
VPQLSVANFSSSPAHVTVQYSQTAGSTPEVKTIATLVVPAGGTSSADLTDLRGDPDLQNTFEVVSDQPPGEVFDNVFSKSETGIRVVELPGKDLDNSHNAGNHPWTVADGTDSTILLFNETTAVEDFPVLVSSGQTVWNKKYSLAPLATKAVDINELIADKVKDDKGFVLPHGLQNGEANWFVTPLFGGTGRVLQSNRSQRSARSFSCGEHSVIIGADFYPDDTSEYAGQTNEIGYVEAQFGLTEGGGCNGDYVGDGGAEYYNWESFNTSIATIAGGGSDDSATVEGMSGGTATVEGNVEDDEEGDFCSASAEGDMTVTDDQTPVITGITPGIWDSLPSASTMTPVTFTGQYFGSNVPTLSFSPGTGISYAVTSHNDSTIGANITIAAGTPTEDVNVTVTNNGYSTLGFAPLSGGQPASNTTPATAAVQAQPAAPALAIAYSSYIPVDHIGGPSGCFYGSTPVQYIYKGDGGYGSYRTTEAAGFNAATLNVTGLFKDTGKTKQYAYGSPANGTTLSYLDEDGISSDCHLWNQTGQASYSGFTYGTSSGGTNLGALEFIGSASNPLETTLAAISWDMITTINYSNPSAPTASVTYNHTCYPAHQVKVGSSNTVVYSFTPPSNSLVYIAACLTIGVDLLTEESGTTGYVSVTVE